MHPFLWRLSWLLSAIPMFKKRKHQKTKKLYPSWYHVIPKAYHKAHLLFAFWQSDLCPRVSLFVAKVFYTQKCMQPSWLLQELSCRDLLLELIVSSLSDLLAPQLIQQNSIRWQPFLQNLTGCTNMFRLQKYQVIACKTEKDNRQTIPGIEEQGALNPFALSCSSGNPAEFNSMKTFSKRSDHLHTQEF